MAGLKLKNIRKIYTNGFPAVQDFNLEIEDNEFVFFVGPSGCGKSATLRMIAGLEEITSGEIWIDDKLVNNLEPKDRDIAFLSQNYAIYPKMTVYENIAFGLRLRNVDEDKIDKRVREVAQTLNLESLLKRRAKTLSEGDKLRVALGRAVICRPKVFLLDNPFSMLSAKLRLQMHVELVKLNKLGATIIYVTNDVEDAMKLGTKIVVFDSGRIQKCYKPEVL